MTNARSLQGLMKWLTRAEWRDWFAEIMTIICCRLASKPGSMPKRSWQFSAKIGS